MILDSTVRRKAFSIGRALTAIAAGRVLYLFVRYLSGGGSIQRFQVESAATVFAVVAVLTALLGCLPRRAEERPSRTLTAEAVVWCGASALLYSSSIGIGLLSDDFVLASHAARAQFGAVNAELFRPLPLMVWMVLLEAGAGPAGLHLLNILMHGITAFLTARLAAAFVSSRALAVGAGLLVLTFPAAPEAVSWCAGVFDVAASMLCALAVLVSRRRTERDHAIDRAALFACTALALLSKETAAVVPVLIGLDAWARRQISKRLIVDASILGGLMAIVAAYRLLHASSLVRRPVTTYVIQRWVFGTAAALIVPWHVDLLHSMAWLALIVTAVTLSLAVGFAVTRQDFDRIRAVLGSAGWAFVATLPTLTFFFVAPNLEGARYVYLASIGWALCLVALGDGLRQAMHHRVDLVGVIAIVICGAIGARLQQAPWRDAGRIARDVARAAESDPRLRDCAAVAVFGVPDNAQGAYVFRNGVEEAFAASGVLVRLDAPPPCRFTWNAAREGFDRRD